MARSWWNLGKIVQDHGKIMIEYWQYCDICDRFDQGSLYLYLWMSKNTAQQEICMKKNHERSWQDHAGIMARSWWDLDKIFQDHGNIIIESCQDCDKILARIMMGSWQDPPRSWQDFGNIFARSCWDLGKIMVRSCQDLPRPWQDYNRILSRLW
jgi:hypothetical protein